MLSVPPVASAQYRTGMNVVPFFRIGLTSIFVTFPFMFRFLLPTFIIIEVVV